MKKILFSLLAGLCLAVTGCYDSTEEISLNADGSGTYSSKNDMSALISMAKAMGGADAMKKNEKSALDTIISLGTFIDSVEGLTPEEKKMAATGNLHINMDMENEIFFTEISFPFAKPAEIAAFRKLSTRLMTEVMKEKTEEKGDDSGMSGMDDMPPMTLLSDFYKNEFSSGEISAKTDDEKYKKAGDDPFLQGVKEGSSMGMTLNVKYIFHLPRPAQKAEGKNVKLSEDKKTVTISATSEDFFEDPSSLEYKIKY